MCGIIGYIGQQKAIPILLDGLKKMEYRGYDSAGLCLAYQGKLSNTKRVGRIVELENALNALTAPIENQPADISPVNETTSAQNFHAVSCLGIAHTRWATHGEPNEDNAHPHLDCTGEIAVVHNGIIENYTSLKDLLVSEGHIFKSQTDSEVLAHLIEKFYAGDLEAAVIKALDLVEGAYGLAVIHARENKIVAARKGSPLVLGIGDNEMLVASDVTAILGQTKQVIYLNDGEIAIIFQNGHQGYTIKNLDGKITDPTIHNIKWTVDQMEKGGYAHFMLKEIFEQPQAITNTLRGRIKNGQIKLSVDIDTANLKRALIVGCGTSWHSGLIGKFLLEKIAGLPTEVDYASEFRYRDPLINPSDLVIGISQSGETADTLAALREAKKRGAKTLGIINVVGSSITREVDSGIYLHSGPEIGVASTKAFTGQITALLLFALYLRQKSGMVLPPELLAEIEQLPALAEQVLKNSEHILTIARELKDAPNAIYLGRGVNFPVALEGALKLKEISYIHAEGYPSAEMKHGPIALIDENMPVVFIVPRDIIYEKVLSNMAEVKARRGKIIAITNSPDQKMRELADYIIEVPEVSSELSPIINTLPLQLLAYHIANLKGLDVDKPRNLAKSVTVE